MASARYTRNIKPEDLIPDQPIQYTRMQRAANWLHYHKWYVLAGAAVLALVLYILFGTVLAPKPDCRVAVVTRADLPVDVLDTLTQRFEEHTPDTNGDGRVLVQLESYVLDFGGSSTGMDAFASYAGAEQLKADLEEGWSGIYLVQDPEALQVWMQEQFWNPDKEPPLLRAEDARPWAQCPAGRLELGQFSWLDGEIYPGQRAMQGFWLLRRPDVPGCEGLWQALAG